MKTYVYRMKRNYGTVARWGYYVFMFNEQGEIVDEAGPFDDEHDAVMAAKRAEDIAA